jgi:hypothetical protein
MRSMVEHLIAADRAPVRVASTKQRDHFGKNWTIKAASNNNRFTHRPTDPAALKSLDTEVSRRS